MDPNHLLFIFAKNPILHRVKTRLAQDIGAENALHIYHHLLAHTRDITAPLNVSKAVYYSDFIPAPDILFDSSYDKRIQIDDDLGIRMYHAFQAEFDNGFTHIIIIGSDCYQLTQSIIETAFLQLETHDAVIGPAVDGGYYLLGMKTLDHTVFDGIQWSTATVLHDTLATLKHLQMSYYLLPELRDVDTVDDLGPLWHLIDGESK